MDSPDQQSPLNHGSISEKRLPLACDRCRKRKQKCDRRSPSCRRCVAAQTACTTNLINLAASNGARGYVDQLEERLQALQSELRQRGAAQASEAPGLHPPTPLASASESNCAGDEGFGGGPPRAARIPNIDSPLAHLTLAAMAEERHMHHSCSFALPTVISAVSRCSGSMITSAAAEMRSLTSIFGQAISTNLTEILTSIPEDEARRFVDSYFENIHPIHPWSDHSSIVTTYSRVASGTASSPEELLTAAVLAMGMDMCGRKQEAAFLTHCVSKHASSCFRAAFTERDRLLDIQGLLLLSIMSLYHPEAGLTWHYVGFTISRAISCGFHREPKPSETRGSSRKALDQCRDVFWSAYCLDRLTSLALGKPVSIQNCDITIDMPSTPGGKRESRDVFVLTKLVSEIRRARGARPSQFYYRLRSWKDSADYDTSTYSGQYIEMLYLRGLILLFETHPSRDQVGSASASEVLSSCTRLIDIAHQWTLNGSPLCWTASCFVFGAGIVHLDILIRDRYSRSQQSLADIMGTFSKGSSTLGTYSQKFAAMKPYHEFYTALAAAGSRFCENEALGNAKISLDLGTVRDFQFISNPLVYNIANDMKIRKENGVESGEEGFDLIPFGPMSKDM